nr:immunoglobulin light chain junction region [Macaca mulatta]MOY10198.1 immunoglobulin light chain junction region [Macaca mulatta]
DYYCQVYDSSVWLF